MAIHTGLNYVRHLAGVVGLSGMKLWESEHQIGFNEKLPVFLVHGGKDDILEYDKVMKSYNHKGWLSSGVKEMKFLKDLDHSITQDSVELVRKFLKKMVPK